jgi:uncharacterized phage protein (TIGR01671 family)
MREILFRGKRCDNDEWVQGYYIRADHHWHKHGIHKDWIICGASANGGWFALHNKYAVKAETVGQFIGLTDKNGKKIFEGDICRFREWSKGEMCWVGKVHWEHQQFMIIGGPNKECETMFELCMSRFSPENIEVIGNIHDNPELLENP